MADIVAIVGRPNVGKSTLFNRLVEKKQAIMDDKSGVTRDRHYGYSEWNGKHFTVIDTGGYVKDSDDIFEKEICVQVEVAIREASVIFFMVDAREGITDQDKEFANVIRKANKPVYVVVNKADSSTLIHASGEFYSLGFDLVFPVSSVSGSGTGEILDDLTAHYIAEDSGESAGDLPGIAIIGKPNVGKSSLLNALLGEERSIVTEIAGTTRDSINTRYNLFGKDFMLVDTAGVRKRAKVKEDIEFYSVMRSIKALQDSDVVLVMVDATQGFESQDMNLITLAHRYKKGIVTLVNKWDLVQKDTKTADTLKKEINEKLGPLDFIPILFISVLQKQRIFQAVEKAMEVYENLHRRIPTSELNDVMLGVIKDYPPPAIKGKYIKIKYITQLPTRTPTIAFFCNLPQYINTSYQRYLENKLRENFSLAGAPVKLIFRTK
ncbi:MAG TPA: ribosome biogenesis GTPase Der [Cyclobacteriaceae bacterium]|nr:ribosome biogenesis GTPase Der [Cyclobacteriaceae bacterium]